MPNLQKAALRLAICTTPLLLGACADQTMGTGEPGPTGSVRLSVTTAGQSQDNDGYQLLVDGVPVGAIGPNAERTFDAVPAGPRAVSLGGVAGNCRTTPTEIQQLTIPEGASLAASFGVTCDSAWRNTVLYMRFFIDTASSSAILRAPLPRAQLIQRLAAASFRPMEVRRMDPDGKGDTLVALGTNGAASPGGDRIVFSSGEMGGILDILTVGTGSVTHLTAIPSWSQQPVWSPDGQRLAFANWASGEAQAYTAKPDGSDLRRISFSDRQETGILWSPRGSRIVLTRSSADYSSNTIIDLAATGGDEHTRATAADYTAGTFDWSRNGERILFNSWAEGGNDLWMMAPDGSGKRNLTPWNDLHNHNFGVWSPDGTQFIFDGDGVMMRADTSGHVLKTLSPDTPDQLDFVTDWIP